MSLRTAEHFGDSLNVQELGGRFRRKNGTHFNSLSESSLQPAKCPPHEYIKTVGIFVG